MILPVRMGLDCPPVVVADGLNLQEQLGQGVDGRLGFLGGTLGQFILQHDPRLFEQVAGDLQWGQWFVAMTSRQSPGMTVMRPPAVLVPLG